VLPFRERAQNTDDGLCAKFRAVYRRFSGPMQEVRGRRDRTSKKEQEVEIMYFVFSKG